MLMEPQIHQRAKGNEMKNQIQKTETPKFIITSISTRRRDYRESSKSRIYFDVSDETILDNLANRKSRPYTEYRKLLPTVFEALEFDPSDPNLKASWSQYAGCSCPCSPGFVIHNTWPFARTNVWVSIRLAQPGETQGAIELTRY